MKNTEALQICKYRIDYVANLYGAKWKEEEPFLKACHEALLESVRQEEIQAAVAAPPEDTDVMVLFDGKTEYTVLENCTGIGRYKADAGWELNYLPDLTDFTIKKWRFMPEWSE